MAEKLTVQMGLEKFVKLPPSQLGEWEDKYKNLQPSVRKALDKAMRSETFKKQAESFGSPAKVLDSFWHWKTSTFNAHEYTGGLSGEESAVISKAEASTIATIFSKPWRAFGRPYWEKNVRKRVLPEYIKTTPTVIDTPDQVLEDIKSGRHAFGYFPEDVDEWLKGNKTYAPSLYSESELERFIRGDVNDGTAVCGFATNSSYYYVRTYTKGADVMKLVKEIPQELKQHVGKKEAKEMG